MKWLNSVQWYQYVLHSQTKAFYFNKSKCRCLTVSMQTLFVPNKIVVVFSTIFKRLYHMLLNQYQACLYLFACIFHGNSKYSNEVQQFWHFWTILWHFWFVVYWCSLLTPVGVLCKEMLLFQTEICPHFNMIAHSTDCVVCYYSYYVFIV